MSYEKYYPGGWQSGESGGTPITPEALNHIENGIKQTYSDFAPAGFGLGGKALITEATKLSDIKETGWYGYEWSIGENPVNGYPGILRVEAIGIMTVQTLYVFSYHNAVLTRQTKTDGTFCDWEWVNPPMVPGVEYRTTERWNDKPVYVKLIDFGTLPNNSNKSVATAVLPQQIVGIVGKSYNSVDNTSSVFPLYYGNSISATFFVNQGGGLVVETFRDMSACAAQILIRYVY